jgi:hypothetical protein
MANDPSLALREAVVTKLRETDALTDIAGDRVYGEQPTDTLPERPFCRYGVDQVTPLPSACGNGAEVEFPIHSFSTKKFTDEVKRMNDIISGAIGGDEPGQSLVLALEGGAKATIVWLGSTVQRDAGDATAWHGIARFRATV